MQEAPNDRQTASPAIRVVLVEDDVVVREQVVSVLGAAGIDVLAAVGGVVPGYAAVVGHHPDVAVVDDRLLDGLGVDLCRRLRGDRPAVRVVVHAAGMTAAERQGASDAGAVAVVAKSVRPDALLHAVRSASRFTPDELST